MPTTPGRTRVPVLIPLVALSVVLTGVAAAPATPPVDPAAPAEVRAARLARSLPDATLVGQVLMPYVYGEHATDVPPEVARANQRYAGVATPAELVERYRPGGVILLRRTGPAGAPAPEGNVSSPEQVRALTAGLHSAARLPLLVGIDQEYGVVTRLTDGVTELPSAMAFGAAGDPALTTAAWRVAGAELAALGVNVNFAPVADVLGPGTSGAGVIGSRSYGADPALATAQVAAAVRGMQRAGVAATLKHFPGHGSTTGDSHSELPVVAASHPLASTDLPPFAGGIDAGASLVMSGHLDVRGAEPGMPATFSRAVVTGLLRDRLGFEGVAVTDALNMAPAQRWPAGEAAVRALLAGNDLLLMPPDLAAARRGVLAALDDGTLPRERLREAVTRVLTLKFRLAGVAAPEPPVLRGAEHREAVAPVAAAAVTLLRGPCPTPGALVDGPVSVTASAGRERARATLAGALADAGAAVTDSGGTVVHLIGYGDGPGDLRDGAAVTVAMDTPHLLARAGSPVLLATYSSSRPSMRALAAVLTGRAAAHGRSPVPVAGLPRAACDH